MPATQAKPATQGRLVIKPAGPANHYSLIVLTRRYFPYITFSHTELERRLESKRIFYLIAQVDGATIGFLDYELKEDKAQILGLAVVEEYRHRGIAMALIRRAIADIQKHAASGHRVDKIDLLVSEENPAAQSLYAKFGFERKGKLGTKLWNQEVLIYSRPLKRAPESRNIS